MTRGKGTHYLVGVANGSVLVTVALAGCNVTPQTTDRLKIVVSNGMSYLG